MNMKNTVILLMFLLCILGLIIGVHYTELNESSQKMSKYEKTVEENDGIIHISLDKIETEEKVIDGLFT
jgi:hypothetical protein